ncbi:MAG: Uma2 family endonuclease, partial [Gammaproteobacteria bacterium]|nr:Uma2 family endonuclease [Gammaproteobacteria bacterium]
GYESLEMVRQEGFAEGEFKGGINAILTVLKTRGLNIDTETEARIYACRDHEQLQAWLGKAALVEKSEDLILRAEKK